MLISVSDEIRQRAGPASVSGDVLKVSDYFPVLVDDGHLADEISLSLEEIGMDDDGVVRVLGDDLDADVSVFEAPFVQGTLEEGVLVPKFSFLELFRKVGVYRDKVFVVIIVELGVRIVEGEAYDGARLELGSSPAFNIVLRRADHGDEQQAGEK